MLEFLKCSYSHHPNRTYSGPLSSNGSVLSDGFLFVLVLYLLADVYLDASPLLAPYLGRSSKPFLECQRSNFQLQSFKIFRSKELKSRSIFQTQSIFEQSPWCFLAKGLSPCGKSSVSNISVNHRYVDPDS